MSAMDCATHARATEPFLRALARVPVWAATGSVDVEADRAVLAAIDAPGPALTAAE
jgi:hypothetical protein